MIQLIPVTQSSNLNSEFRAIYEQAFPPDERREWDQLCNLFENPDFSMNEVYQNKTFIGFISVWNLSFFHFIEHFAIRKTEQGKSYGTQVIDQLISTGSKRIILEVEEPFTDSAVKRISFYERLNFSIVSDEYHQPPYSAGQNKVKMLLMSYPEKINSIDFSKIKALIYEHVYNFKESQTRND